MAQEINDQFDLKAPKLLEKRTSKFTNTVTTPYGSIQEVLDTIVPAYRSRFLDVYVLVGGVVKWYWWKDGTADNQLIEKTDLGLLTANNGMNKNQLNFQLGGPLVMDTNISGNYLLTIDGGRLKINEIVGIGTDPRTGYAVVVLGHSEFKGSTDLLNDIQILNSNNATVSADAHLKGGDMTQSAPFVTAAGINTMYLEKTGNTTLPFLANIGAHASVVIKKDNGTYQGGTLANYVAITELGGAGDITAIAGFRVLPPKQRQPIGSETLSPYTGHTSMLGIVIEDLKHGSDIPDQLSIVYGLLQKGKDDRNFIAGEIRYENVMYTKLQVLTYGSTTVWDLSKGMEAKLVAAGNGALSITNLPLIDGFINGNGGAVVYGTISIQNVPGNAVISLPAGSKVANGGNGVLTLTPTVNAIDIWCFRYDGTNFFWKKGQNYT